MIADAIIRYSLDDYSSDPELVKAVEYSARTLHTGDLGYSEMHAFDLMLTTPAAIETVRLP